MPGIIGPTWANSPNTRQLGAIIGTPYDFEGKARYITRMIGDRGLDPASVLFVGNSCNDIFARQSGATTLCVNPHLTDPADVRHWTHIIHGIKDLREILRFTRL